MSERTKSRSGSLGQMAFVPEHWVGDHLQVGSFAEGVSSRDYLEQITYGTGSKFNRCQHSKAIYEQTGSPQSCGYCNDVAWRVTKDTNPTSAPTLTPRYELNGSSYSVPYPRGAVEVLRVPLARRENARTEAYARLRQLVPTSHMNATQAVMELKDTKQTLTPLFQFLSWARTRMGRKVPMGRRIMKPLTSATKIARVASAYLWYKFGVEPTVTDVRRFLKEISNGQLRVTGMQSKYTVNRGTVLVSRFKAQLEPETIAYAMFPHSDDEMARGATEFKGSFVRTYQYNPWGGVSENLTLPTFGSNHAGRLNSRLVKVEDELSGAYFATVKEDLQIDGLDDLRRRWGWNCPALATMWELTPFSFLVDWVVDVGGAIRLLERRYLRADLTKHLGPIWVWERSGYSVYRAVQNVTGHATRLPPVRREGYNQYPIQFDWELNRTWSRVSRVTTFVRRPLGTPPSWVVPEWGGSLKAYQITTGMALIAQAAQAWIDYNAQWRSH